MRLIELAGSCACLYQAFAWLSVSGEFLDLGLALPVSLRHIDLVFARDEDIVGLEEKLRLDPAARLAERHQDFSVRAELVHLMSDRGAGQRTARAATTLRLAARGAGPASSPAGGAARRTRRVVLVIGDPHLAVAIDEDAVRADEQSRAETPDQPAVGV